MIFIDWLCLSIPCFDEVNFDGNKHNSSSAVTLAIYTLTCVASAVRVVFGQFVVGLSLF